MYVVGNLFDSQKHQGGFPLGDKCRATRYSIVKIEYIFN